MEKDLVLEIKKLKQERGAVILAHNYQIPPIQDIADLLGDSLELAKVSRNLKNKLIVFCGVKFMAETAKILSPEKLVLLPVMEAGCPLADSISVDELKALRRKYPDYKVVSYVNSSAEVKALSDVCCTSANAVEVVRKLDSRHIIFTPDKNLGWWVKNNVPEKDMIIWEGFCPVHEKFDYQELKEARDAHPEAEVIVHPECPPEILENSDCILSTAGMLKRAKESKAENFIVGTEEGMIYRLKKENPHKHFYSLGKNKICEDMKKIELNDLYLSLRDKKYAVSLDERIINAARGALERMVAVG
ncbi:MAG: quinolinate synthase NadA [Candidatus Omnitrophica bacterium]|nr:quinolinate synthase NadA [Candidatus Omnitrophota bacterium]MBD3268953.1 quinolinate synthase NadA [Candidatus Omnitrophota bacterium]